VVGYFLGQAKFKKMGPVWLPLGLLLAASLNGLISLLLERAPSIGTRFGFNLWAALITAVVVAGAIFAVLLTIMRRLNSSVTANA
jgi:hypothetical protein